MALFSPYSTPSYNYLVEFQQTLKLTSSSCSFPTGVSQTLWNFTIDFYGKHLTFLSNAFIQQNVD